MNGTEPEQTETEQQMLLEAAQQYNEQNARCSAGRPDGGGDRLLLTPMQVRAMSRREVHDNYALILESMQHWQ